MNNSHLNRFSAFGFVQTEPYTSVARDIIEFLIIIGLSFYSIFYLSWYITYPVFIIFYIFAWRAKRDYIWFAVCMVFFANPADLFNQGAANMQYRLPLFTFAPGLSFNVTDLFIILFLLKSIIKAPAAPVLIRPVFNVFFLLMAIGLLMAFMYGSDIDTLVLNLRIYFTATAVYSFIKLVRNRENIYRFFILVSLLMPVVFIEQILNYFDTSILNELDKSTTIKLILFTDSEAKRLTMKGVLINFLCIVLPFAFLKRTKKIHLWFYLLIIIVVISNFISATRFWIYSLAGFIALLTLVSARNISVMLRIVIISLLVAVAFFRVELPAEQFQAIIDRVVPAASSLIQGNIEDVDSGLTRLEKIKSYKLIIEQSKMIGYGFSSANFNDNDLGFWNTLIAFGYLGFIAYLFMLIYIIYQTIVTVTKFQCTSESRHLLLVFLLGWFIIILGYLTTWDFFHTGADRLFTAVCYAGMINIIIAESRMESIALST